MKLKHSLLEERLYSLRLNGLEGDPVYAGSTVPSLAVA
jgi:hypothetical protein